MGGGGRGLAPERENPFCIDQLAAIDRHSSYQHPTLRKSAGYLR